MVSTPSWRHNPVEQPDGAKRPGVGERVADRLPDVSRSVGLAEVAVDRGDQPAQPVRVELVLPAEFQQHQRRVRPSTRRLCASFTQRTTLPSVLCRDGLRCLRDRASKPHLLLRAGPFGRGVAPIARSTRGTPSANSAAVRAVSGRSTRSAPSTSSQSVQGSSSRCRNPSASVPRRSPSGCPPRLTSRELPHRRNVARHSRSPANSRCTCGSRSSGAAPSRARAECTGTWSSAGRRRRNPPGCDCRRSRSRSGSCGASGSGGARVAPA